MSRKAASILLAFLMLFVIPTTFTQAEETDTVDVFGDGFTEVVIASYLDYLNAVSYTHLTLPTIAGV